MDLTSQEYLKDSAENTGCETLNANYIGLLCPMKFAFRVSHSVLLELSPKT